EGKLPHYQPSIGVPLLVRGPGIRAGVTQHALVSNVDLAATVADVAGAEPDAPIDGRSLRPLLARPTNRPGNVVVLEGWPLPDDPEGRMVEEGIVTARFRYTEHVGGARELYDLRADPAELVSRHDDPAYDRVRRALVDLRARMRRCVGAACRPVARIRLHVARDSHG